MSYRPAAEGSPCGEGQICHNGRCILENENAIPDYAEEVGLSSFLRRTDTILAATESKPFFVPTTTHHYTTTTTTTTTTAAPTTTTTTTSKPITTTTVPWWHTTSKSSTRFVSVTYLCGQMRRLNDFHFDELTRAGTNGGTSGPSDQRRRLSTRHRLVRPVRR